MISFIGLTRRQEILKEQTGKTRREQRKILEQQTRKYQRSVKKKYLAKEQCWAQTLVGPRPWTENNRRIISCEEDEVYVHYTLNVCYVYTTCPAVPSMPVAAAVLQVRSALLSNPD